MVGVGRSGTSLVQAMLHAHPDISFLPENHLFRRYVAPPLRQWWMKIGGGSSFVRTLRNDRYLSNLDLDIDAVLAARRGRSSLSPAAIYWRLLEFWASRAGSRWVGDKDPRLIDFLPPLAEALPESFVVHVIRDPRDVLVSRRKAAWSRGRPDLLHQLAYRAQMRRALSTGRRWFGERYVELRYEDLLREPLKQLKHLCEILGVDYSSRMLSFGDAARDLVREEELQWKKETLGPLQRDNMGKWRRELCPRTLLVTEELCLEPFPELGYQRESPPLAEHGVGSRWRVRVLRGLATLFAEAYPLRTLVG